LLPPPKIRIYCTLFAVLKLASKINKTKNGISFAPYNIYRNFDAKRYLEGSFMGKSVTLNTRLNPKGVQGLKKKLIAGEITAETFKTVIKRQILKQNNITPVKRKSKTLSNSIYAIRKNIQLFLDRFTSTMLDQSLIGKKFKISLKNYNLI